MIPTLVAALLVAAPPAKPAKDADAVFQQGVAYFKAGAFEEAAASFIEAFQLDRRPSALFNAARAYEEAGDIEQAVSRYRWYLVQESKGSAADEARARLKVLETKLNEKRKAEARAERGNERRRAAVAAAKRGEHDAAANTFEEAFRLTDDPELVFEIGVQRALAKQDRRALAEFDRYLGLAPKGKRREDALAKKLAIEDRLSKAGASTEPVTSVQTPSEELELPVGPVVVGTLGVLSFAAAIAFGQAASSAQSELEDVCPTRQCNPASDWMSIRDRGETNAFVSDIFLAGGIAGVGGGLLWWLLDGPDDAEVAVAPNGAAVRVRF